MAGGMCGGGGAYVAGGGRDMHGRGGHAWHAHPPPADTTRYGDTVNERAVRILLECILVLLLNQELSCNSVKKVMAHYSQHFRTFTETIVSLNAKYSTHVKEQCSVIKKFES